MNFKVKTFVVALLSQGESWPKKWRALKCIVQYAYGIRYAVCSMHQIILIAHNICLRRESALQNVSPFPLLVQNDSYYSFERFLLLLSNNYIYHQVLHPVYSTVHLTSWRNKSMKSSFPPKHTLQLQLQLNRLIRFRCLAFVGFFSRNLLLSVLYLENIIFHVNATVTLYT